MGIFDAFTGKAQAKDIKRANAEATGYINQGFDKAENAVGEARTAAQGYFQPYGQSGVRYNALLEDALGMNGADGGGRAMTAYRSASNPYLDYQQNETENALMRSFNARGQSNSGASAAAAAKARMGLGYQDYQGWLDRVGQQQGQGVQVAGQQAGIEQGYGQQRADLATGRAGTLAGNAVNYGNAMAATRGVGINNLLSLVGTGIKGYSALYPKGIT